MVAIDAVPWHAAHAGGVDSAPLQVPRGVVLACDTTRIERVANVDDKLHIPQFGELLVHPVGDHALAVPTHVSVRNVVKTPVPNHHKGCDARSRRLVVSEAPEGSVEHSQEEQPLAQGQVRHS